MRPRGQGSVVDHPCGVYREVLPLTEGCGGLCVEREQQDHGDARQFWQANMKDANTIFREALTSRIITANHAALLMMRRRSGLIVEVTENDFLGGGGNPMAQAVKGG